MINYTVYNSHTGEILYNLSCNDQTTADANLIDSSYIPGTYSGQQYYIQNNMPVDKGQALSANHVFDYTTKTWQLDLQQLAHNLRHTRNILLTDIDRVNTVWYAALTTQQQNELQAYRQALLDVPQQAGFPEQVEWPAKPAWL